MKIERSDVSKTIIDGLNELCGRKTLDETESVEMCLGILYALQTCIDTDHSHVSNIQGHIAMMVAILEASLIRVKKDEK